MEHDEVERPKHYNMGSIEVLDFILDQELPYLAGNILKYICRYRYKGEPVQDLKKAKYYLERLIEVTEAAPEHGPCLCKGNCKAGRK